MIRGCQREMIMLQVDGSEMFESAWLVLRRERGRVSECDMLAEANRIIGAGNGRRDASCRRGRAALWFLLGAVCSALIFAGIIIFLVQ